MKSRMFFAGALFLASGCGTDDTRSDAAPTPQDGPPTKPLRIYIMAGRNMVGLGINAELTPAQAEPVVGVSVFYEDFMHMNPNVNQWFTLAPGFGVSPWRFGPELSFGRMMTPESQGLRASGRVEIAGFLWLQGETDAINEQDAAAYHDNFLRFVHAIRRDFGVSDLPIVAGLIQDRSGLYAETVRQGTMQVAREVAMMATIETNDIEVHADDPVHYNTAGVLEVGDRLAKALQALPPSQ